MESASNPIGHDQGKRDSTPQNMHETCGNSELRSILDDTYIYTKIHHVEHKQHGDKIQIQPNTMGLSEMEMALQSFPVYADGLDCQTLPAQTEEAPAVNINNLRMAPNK
jgi:hypothetical protein